MARAPKLNDLQRILLSTAAQRDDGSLMPPPEQIAGQAARILKVIPPLIKHELVQEIEVTDANRSWREDGDLHFGLIITEAGRQAIGVATPEAETALAPATAVAKASAQSAQRSNTKISSVLTLLKRDAGATLNEIVEATGWLPHTTRAALTGLRKKGHTIAKSSREGATVYSIGTV